MAAFLDYTRPMTRGRLIIGAAFFMLIVGLHRVRTHGQQPPAASFKAGVDLVRIAAVVRDHKGRFVQDLKPRDFEVLDDGRSRAISDLQADVVEMSSDGLSMDPTMPKM
jgi:hypothetical protein